MWLRQNLVKKNFGLGCVYEDFWEPYAFEEPSFCEAEDQPHCSSDGDRNHRVTAITNQE